MSNDCVFCEIVDGSSPASVVWEDELVMAFLDLQPVRPGHTLLVPKVHAESMGEMEVSTGSHLFGVSMRIAEAIRLSLGAEGINLFVADGEAAGQEVPHFHLHVIPRTEGDGFGLTFPPTYPYRLARSELDKVAESITDVLAET